MSGGFVVDGGGVLDVDDIATLHASQVTNDGEIVLGGPGSRVTSRAELINTGTMRGSGLIDAAVENRAGGVIEASGLALRIGDTTNNGLIQVQQGGLIVEPSGRVLLPDNGLPLGDLENVGTVAVDDSVLRFEEMNNRGDLLFNAGANAR